MIASMFTSVLRLRPIALACCLAMGAVRAPGDESRSATPENVGRKEVASATHWAFQPVRSINPPAVKLGSWVQTDVDRFILSRLETIDALPACEADQRTLLRRVSYDLTGLPPTQTEMDAFLADSSADAYARVVERLLASPQYGEHWGRHWLDVVRYADTAGENSDHPLPQAWKYRNWVIGAFNSDLPYDEFLRDQIAGDLIARQCDATELADRIIATGYLAIARRFGHDIDKDIHLTFEDAIDNLGKTVLGLSVGCARCHDHKYDPISARDYYGLYGIFASTRFPFPGCEPSQLPRDLVPVVPEAEAARLLKPFEAELARLDAEIKTRETELADAEKDPGEPVADRKKKAVQALAEAKNRKGEFASKRPVPVAYAVAEGSPKDVRIHKRGDPEKLGDEVPRKFLEVLGGQTVSDTNRSGRLELAGWLTDPSNPLTARVMVNRIWHWHFGQGLVSTPNDFGTRSQPPTHPDLLDWLAGEFIRSGWSMKALHRQILLSATYRQASSRSDSLPAPEHLYAVFPLRRLSAEEIRDTLLSITGELDKTPGDAHPFPPEHQWSFTQHGPFAAEYETMRRSVYVMQKRNRRTPFFALFDGADPNASTAQRDVTTVPTQALYFLNDPFVHARAEKFAAQVLASGQENEQRMNFAFRQLFGRPPAASELKDGAEFLGSYNKGGDDGVPNVPSFTAWAAYARILFGSNELLHVD